MERDAGHGCGCGGGCGVRLSLVDVAGAVEAQDGALRHAEEQQGRRRRDRALQPQREREAIEDDDACRGGRCGVLRHVAARDASACVRDDDDEIAGARHDQQAPPQGAADVGVLQLQYGPFVCACQMAVGRVHGRCLAAQAGGRRVCDGLRRGQRLAQRILVLVCGPTMHGRAQREQRRRVGVEANLGDEGDGHRTQAEEDPREGEEGGRGHEGERQLGGEQAHAADDCCGEQRLGHVPAAGRRAQPGPAEQEQRGTDEEHADAQARPVRLLTDEVGAEHDEEDQRQETQEPIEQHSRRCRPCVLKVTHRGGGEEPVESHGRPSHAGEGVGGGRERERERDAPGREDREERHAAVAQLAAAQVARHAEAAAAKRQAASARCLGTGCKNRKDRPHV